MSTGSPAPMAKANDVAGNERVMGIAVDIPDVVPWGMNTERNMIMLSGQNAKARRRPTANDEWKAERMIRPELWHDSP